MERIAPQAHPQQQPAVEVAVTEETIDVRLWARRYVQLLFSLEGVALVPVTLPRAS